MKNRLFPGRLPALSLALALALTLAACGSPAQTESPGSSGGNAVIEVTVGVVGGSNDQWDTVNQLLADEGIHVTLEEFSEYKLPNEALNSGDIDLNAFQHKAYLEQEIEELGYELSILGDTVIAPLALYSNSITDVSQLQEGDTIAVPSDPTNQGRCFKILESAGLLEVDPAAGYTPELKDITSNPLNLEFVEVEASNTPSLLPDVTAAFVNGAHAVDHGLSLDDAVYTEQVEPGSDNPYINVLVCRTQDLDNEVYQKVLAAYQSDETAQAIEEIFQGAYLPAWA